MNIYVSMVSAEARSNWLIAHAPLMYARYVYARAVVDTIVKWRVGLLGEPWTDFYSMQPGSQFLLAQASIPLTALSGP